MTTIKSALLCIMSLDSKILQQMHLAISTELTATTLFANVQRWFQKFNSGNESLKNEPRGRLASMIEDNVLNTCIEKDTSQTSRELAKRIGVNHTAILKHLHVIGKVWKMDKWVPHELSEKN